MKDLKLIIKKDAQKVGVHNSVTCIIDNLTIRTEDTSLKKEIEDVLTMVSSNKEAIYSSDCYSGFKLLFSNLGYPNQLTACDRLINYYSKKGFKSINNIVDSYNICSVLFGSPMGLHDASKISGDVTIRLAEEGEDILPMFKNSRRQIIPGDLVYQARGKTICWMGKEDIDSDEYKVTNETQSIFIMAIGNEKTNSDYNLKICNKIYELIKKSCPNATFNIVPTILE